MPDPATSGSSHGPRPPFSPKSRGSLKPPTLDEVALRAGVSRSAASRAMNNARHVSPAKREAVLRAADELGYIPNATARALATSRVGTVVLVVANEAPTFFGDPFFSQVIVGVATALELSELDLTLMLASSADAQSRLERMLRARRADGVMLMASRSDDPLARVAQASGIPVVFCGRPLVDGPCWYVDADNRGGARSATEHLWRSGRRRIAAITGPMDLEASVARYQGFIDAMTSVGCEPGPVEEADFTREGGAQAMERLLKLHPDLDAVFVGSDNMAAGAIKTLNAHARSVPHDIAVVGFDDLGVAEQTEPPLTTVSQPIHDLGHQMATMLIRLINGEKPSSIILPTQLVVRESAPSLAAEPE